MKTISEITKHFPNIEFSDKYLEVLKELSENDNACINVIGNAGSGKAQPLDTIIPTPNGNMKFGDLKVGDYVFDRKGNPTKVTHIFPQGELELYKVTLSDGRVTYCNDEHLWTYITSKNIVKTCTLREMIDNGIKGEDKRGHKFNKYKILTNDKVEFNNSIEHLEVDPYVIGSFLGNGCNLEKQLTLSSDDEFNVSECARLLNYNYEKNSDKNYNWSFKYVDESQRPNDVRIDNIHPLTRKVFEKYTNELCVKSNLKRIPNDYKYSTIENRYKLLQGLFDTDGSVSIDSRCNVSYSSTSKQLIDDICEILHSLGYMSSVSINERIKCGKKSISYNLRVRCENEDKFKLFRLPRKLERIEKYATEKKLKNYDRISIDKVEDMKYKVPMMCIMVDNDEHLYLTNDYIVTHNSTLLGIIHYAFEDENIVVCGTTGVSSALLNASHPEVKATTIHSMFALKAQTIFSSTPDFVKTEVREVIENMDILIIDEISMANCSLLDYILRMIFTCRRVVFKDMPKIVLFGDVLQLPPVINTRDNIIKNFFDDEYEGKYFYFNSKCFKKMNPKIIQLSKVYRQEGDSSFKDVLNRIRVNKATEDDLKLINSRVVDECEFMADNESAIRLVTTNKEVELYNKIGSDMLPNEPKRVYATFEGNFKMSSDYKEELYPDMLEIKEGSPVMITRNEPSEYRSFVNGDIGILEELTNEHAMVKLNDGRVVEVPRMETIAYEYGVEDSKDENNVKTKHVKAREIGKYINIPIRTCFSSTIHKCQGRTIDKCIIDLGNWITPSIVYVALSRVRNINDICLTRKITLNDIKVNMEAIEWLNEHTEIEDEKASSDVLEKLKENDKEKILKMIKDWEEKYNCKW